MVVGIVGGNGVGNATASSVTPTTPTNSSFTDSDGQVPLEGGRDGENLDNTSRTDFSVPEPDHGVETNTFLRLWSGDVDEATVGDAESVQNVLLGATDYAFDRPPEAVFL